VISGVAIGFGDSQFSAILESCSLNMSRTWSVIWNDSPEVLLENFTILFISSFSSLSGYNINTKE
jgi:hypothetical protein